MRNVKGENINGGYVHRNRQQRIFFVYTALTPFCHFVPDEFIQVRNEPVIFQRRDKITRHDHGTVFTDPSGQRFRAHDLPGFRIALRLQEKGNLSVSQRVLESRKGFIIVLQLIIHGFIKIPDAVFEVAFRIGNGHLCLIMQAHHRVIALGTGYAKSRQEAERSSISVQHVTYMLKQYFGVQFPYRDHQAKVVVPQIPRKAVTMFSVFGKPRSNPGQHLVPCFKPIPFVKELELFQIDDDHHPVDSSFLQQLFCSVKEITICRKSCQGIQHDLLFPVDLCPASFPVLDLLNIKNITAKNTFRQTENGTANHYRIHPFPLAFQVLCPELELQGSRQFRLSQPVP